MPLSQPIRCVRRQRRSRPAYSLGDACRRHTGRSHTWGIRTDHTLWCWGFNECGQLGLGDIGDRLVPQPVANGTRWASALAAALHTYGVRTDHTLWCWGNNDYGQLGLDDLSDRHTPVQVGSDTDWSFSGVISGSGSWHNCGIRTDHTLWCWGWNRFGQLGLGDTLDRLVPTRL